LAVVPARPHVAAVGDEPQVGQLVARLADPAHRGADADRRQSRVEKRTHDAQRDQVAKRVLARGFRGRKEAAARPVAQLRNRAARESRRLRGGVTQLRLRVVATADPLAPGATLFAEDTAEPAARAQPSRERLETGPTELAHVAL